ncbi:MAG: ABC transporter permease [Nitrospinota bacterium]
MNPALFAKFASVTFQKQITYRFDYFMGILNGFLYVFIFTSLWRALYAHMPQEPHSGFTLTGIITYAVFAMALKISFSMDDTVVYKKVQDGGVAIDLMRPVSFYFMNLAESVGYSIFHIFARALPILVISVLIFNVHFDMGLDRVGIFAVSALFGYLILFMINYLIGLLAFWFLEVFPFQLFKYGLITFLSGGIVPVDFFPDAMRPFIMMLPFQYIHYTPTVIILGHVDAGRAAELVLYQAVWVVLLALLSKSAWSAGKNKLVIQGG